MQICPSILENKTEDIFATVKRLKPYYKYFQIDIADGIYVKNKTASIDEFIDYLKGSVAPDPYKELAFDFHLMVNDYHNVINKICSINNLINIKNILIHFSVFPKPYPLNPKPYSIPIGLTLNPQDHVTDLTSHYALDTIPCIQIMSVVPGVQGNPFLPDTLKKIEQLRLLGYKSKIFLDGGVNDKTIPYIMKQKYKPDVVCPGSFLTKAKDLKGNVQYLEKYKS